MKANKNIIKSALLLTFAAAATTSCQDWLTVYPQSQVVEEQFWEDKNDLEGVRYAAYANMTGSLDKIILWGELRSDNNSLWPTEIMSDNNFINTTTNYKNMMDGHLERDSTNSYFDWARFYTTINLCNKVLQHGQEVLNRDKQFTPSEWRQMRAEMIGLRALNYFYLLRSFKDIPYTTQVINNDTEVRDFPATNQLVVLDSLIADVEAIKGQARNRFEYSGNFTAKQETKSKITNAAIYALLSDMYLWRASLNQGRGLNTKKVFIAQKGDSVTQTVESDYQSCITYADEAMKNLSEQLQNQSSGSFFFTNEMISYGLPYVNLYKNDFTPFMRSSSPLLPAHMLIFSLGSSDETIFELSFNIYDSRKNDLINAYWGMDNNHYFSTVDNQLDDAYGNGSATKYNDARMWFNSWKDVTTSTTSLAANCCFKWNSVVVDVSNMGTTPNVQKIRVQNATSSYRNWIVYRLSDVMLQKAEALACLNTLNADPAKQADAMRLVHALHRRWFCNDKSSSQPSEDVSSLTASNWGPASLSASTPSNLLGNLPKPTLKAGVNNKLLYEVAVLNERQIEFFAEGKRWFDLVRFAERHAGGSNGTQDPREFSEAMPIGDGREGVNLMISQFFPTLQSGEKESLKTQLKNRYGLYNLIYYMEIKASNGALLQNPVWNKSVYDK